MAASQYGHRRRERAPKPLWVPLTAMAVGFFLVLLGLAARSILDIAGLGLIFFFWGLLSASTLLIKRRARAGRAASVRT